MSVARVTYVAYVAANIQNHRGEVMISTNQDYRSHIPDLRDLPPDHRALLGDTALAYSLALYRQRLEESGELVSAFNSMIDV
jgi:hypothetical protein